jgi:hypothetical protein
MLAAAVATILSLCSTAEAVDPTKSYFWVAPSQEPGLARYGGLFEGYVVEVTAEVAQKYRDLNAIRGRHIGIAGEIAPGSVDYNRNYFLPGHPVWNWHFTAVTPDDVRQIPFCIDFCEDPQHNVKPSDIAKDPDQWIADNGDQIYPNYFEVKGEIHPQKADALANVSNRGNAGAGEKALITGFIVTGGEPRNVVVRGLGPSLSAQGIQGFASNPRIDVFDANGNSVGFNTDWKTNSRADALNARYPALAPADDNEAALLLTLLPGAYTVQGTNEDGTEGVMVIEAYDVDAVPQ